MVVGVALLVLIVAGAITWQRAGEHTDCMNNDCISQYNGKGVGIAMTALGVAAAGAGAWLFVDGLTTRGTQVAVGPGSLAIAGRF